MSEKCDRCEVLGDDRRTIFMSCLYDMDELGLPLKMLEIKGTTAAKIGLGEPTFVGTRPPVFADHDGEPRRRRFYTLRVCKSCRADWLDAVQEWFRNPPQQISEDA